jgi:hypothetical protein
VARSGWINGNDVIAVIDEAHGLDITMIGVHLALRGVPKVLMTADPALLSYPRTALQWLQVKIHDPRFAGRLLV